MIITFWIACGAALGLTIVAWWVRAAAVNVDPVPTDSGAGDAAERAAPQAIAWPHPPRRLWSAGR